MSSKVRHSGIVDSVSEGCVHVRILQTTACASCKIAGQCHSSLSQNTSESRTKLVDVLTTDPAAFRIGQSVVVSASHEVATQALFFGFCLPFLVLVTVLVVVSSLSGDEAVAALSSLGALVPYYFLLWLFRDRLGQRISFQIESENE